MLMASWSVHQVTGSPYTTGAPMNAGSGSPFVDINTGDQLGRIGHCCRGRATHRITSMPRYSLLLVTSGCGGGPGCQIGAWATTNVWYKLDLHGGLSGGSLTNCGGGGPERLAPRTGTTRESRSIRIILTGSSSTRSMCGLLTRTGTVWNDITCGYSGGGPTSCARGSTRADIPAWFVQHFATREWTVVRTEPQRDIVNPNDGSHLV
jgi:hypothetical protein